MSGFDDIQSLLDNILEDKPQVAIITPPAPTLAVANQVFADSKDPAEVLPQLVPTFTTDELAKTLDLRNFATLVTWNSRRWSAKIKDRQVAKDAALANNADERAFEARKRLLAGADDKLKLIHKIIDAARSRYYELTLPWARTGVDDVGRRSGARLLPNTLFFQFTEEMAKYRSAMQTAVDDFVPDYPNLIEQAKINLGKRFDASEYPTAETIRGYFDLSFDFQAIPMGSDFRGLPEQQVKALAASIETKMQVQLENAMQDLWLRLKTAVEHMAERLSHPDKMFHATLVSNMEAVVTQLKHLNVTGDKRIEAIREYVEQNLCNLDVEDLRKKPTVRTKAAAQAQTVLDMMEKAVRNGTE